MIGYQIRKVRENKGLKRPDLAAKLGIDESTLGRIENNQVKVSAERLLKISEILNVPINDFFEGESVVNFNNNHINIAYINQFIESQKEVADKQSNLLNSLLEENNRISTKLLALIDKFLSEKGEK